MSHMRRLIQNAVYFPAHEFYLKSSYRHDYRTFEYLPGHEAMVDGGPDYIRRSVTPPEHAHLAVDWDLYSDSPHEEVLHKLLWGSLPLDKTLPQVHTYRPIRLLAKSHLKAIWENCPNAAPLHREVVRHWLDTPSL